MRTQTFQTSVSIDHESFISPSLDSFILNIPLFLHVSTSTHHSSLDITTYCYKFARLWCFDTFRFAYMPKIQHLLTTWLHTSIPAFFHAHIRAYAPTRLNASPSICPLPFHVSMCNNWTTNLRRQRLAFSSMLASQSKILSAKGLRLILTPRYQCTIYLYLPFWVIPWPVIPFLPMTI